MLVKFQVIIVKLIQDFFGIGGNVIGKGIFVILYVIFNLVYVVDSFVKVSLVSVFLFILIGIIVVKVIFDFKLIEVLSLVFCLMLVFGVSVVDQKGKSIVVFLEVKLVVMICIVQGLGVMFFKVGQIIIVVIYVKQGVLVVGGFGIVYILVVFLFSMNVVVFKIVVVVFGIVSIFISIGMGVFIVCQVFVSIVVVFMFQVGKLFIWIIVFLFVISQLMKGKSVVIVFIIKGNFGVNFSGLGCNIIFIIMLVGIKFIVGNKFVSFFIVQQLQQFQQ